jgi:molybdopterin molybdotransferase
MAQLRDDCFVAGDALMPLAEALEVLRQRVDAVDGHEAVPLREAIGRILAADITAGRDVPPHDNSAVDGYAVHFDDLATDGPTRLAVAGRAAAGHPLIGPAQRGQAIRIFTGAPMPPGPDTVFMDEDAQVDGDAVVLPAGLKRGSNRRHAGEDVRRGTLVLGAGMRLRPQEVGLAASIGRTDLPVVRRLKVAVFSTGDEVRDPGTDIAPGCIYDANRYALMGLLDDLGCAVTDLGILADDLGVIQGALAAAAPEHDLLITSGGVSLGEEDHVKAAVEALGSLHFWRLAIKPGRPVALGQVGDTVFVGLPGNPVAVMVTFMVIARPLILLLAGCRDVAAPFFRVRAGFDHKKKSGRREFLRARLVLGEDGPVAERFAADGAGILTSMVEADGLVEVGEDLDHFGAGEMVNFLPFNEVAR